MLRTQRPNLILFSQHGMTDNNQDMAALANDLGIPHAHVIAPNLGWINTLFQIEPLIQKVERSAEQTFHQFPEVPKRIIATSLGGIIWVEVLSRHYEWWPHIESLVLLGSPIGGADVARIVDPFGWGIGIAKHLGKNRRDLAEAITAVIPTLVVAGNTTGGSDGTVPIESTKLKQAHFVRLDGVSHKNIKTHPAVIKTIQEFWSEPRTPLPLADSSLSLDLIDYFRAVSGMTDARERYFHRAKTVLTFYDGTTLRTWSNPLRVKHLFIADTHGICQYSGFVGWVHTAGLEQAINKLQRRLSL